MTGRVTVAALELRVANLENQLDMMMDEIVFLREYFDVDGPDAYRPIVDVPGPDTYEGATDEG